VSTIVDIQITCKRMLGWNCWNDYECTEIEEDADLSVCACDDILFLEYDDHRCLNKYSSWIWFKIHFYLLLENCVIKNQKMNCNCVIVFAWLQISIKFWNGYESDSYRVQNTFWDCSWNDSPSLWWKREIKHDVIYHWN